MVKTIFSLCSLTLMGMLLLGCEEQSQVELDTGEALQGSAEAETTKVDIAASCEFVQQVLDTQKTFAAAAERVAEARHLVGVGRQLLREKEELHTNDSVDTEENAEKEGRLAGKVKPGSTMVGLLEQIDGYRAQSYVNAAAQVFSLRSFRAGQPYVVIKDANGSICRFEYEVNAKQRLIVEGDAVPKARLEDIEYTTVLALCEGVIDDSLFQAVADIGESPQLTLKLVDLFGSEINFLRHIQEGDRFSILVEKRFRQGDYKGYGRILAARFTNRGKTYEAWLFRDGQGKLNYYNGKGENLKKTLLISPLAFTRLSSKFTHARKHPIIGDTRPHLGVDYAAPTGTPVKAVGQGIVTQRGWAGGYGNQIIIKHGAGLESMYAHLSGYASGLREGQEVRQGQVIGFVGSTGLATGPHLDFRLKHKGEFINPSKAINPRGESVSPGLMPQFKKIVALQRGYLNGGKLPDNYTPNSIVPLRVTSLGSGFASRALHKSENKGRIGARQVLSNGKNKRFEWSRNVEKGKLTVKRTKTAQIKVSARSHKNKADGAEKKQRRNGKRR